MSVNPANPPMVDASVVSRTTATLEDQRNNHFIFFFSRFIPIPPPSITQRNCWISMCKKDNCRLNRSLHLDLHKQLYTRSHHRGHHLESLHLESLLLRNQQNPESDTTSLTPLPLHSPVLSFAQRLFMFIILFVTQILIFLCLC
jgi:hypothetical protein